MWHPGFLIPYPPSGWKLVSLWALPQSSFTTLPTSRLPDLTTVILVDSPMPGTLLLDEVVAAGSKEQHLAQLRHTQQFLSCHDPVNIQFTSVGHKSPSPKLRLACCPLLAPMTLPQE